MGEVAANLQHAHLRPPTPHRSPAISGESEKCQPRSIVLRQAQRPFRGDFPPTIGPGLDCWPAKTLWPGPFPPISQRASCRGEVSFKLDHLDSLDSMDPGSSMHGVEEPLLLCTPAL